MQPLRQKLGQLTDRLVVGLLHELRQGAQRPPILVERQVGRGLAEYDVGLDAAPLPLHASRALLDAGAADIFDGSLELRDPQARAVRQGQVDADRLPLVHLDGNRRPVE